jgi:ureidoglycolate dehydrogenase (NAD+)
MLVASGLKEVDATQCATMLVQTSLWGIDSHGIARLPHYLERLSRGSLVARPTMVFTQTGPATGDFDGGHGLGFLVCSSAMDHAITLARAAGVGVVGIRNSSHCGAIGLYARQATAHGMIGIAFTHSDSFVAPHGGHQAFFGTNPIALSVPTEDPVCPLCLDMATSIAPINRVMNARKENTRLEPGLGYDRDGRETTDPHALVTLKPLGAHKGYGLGFLIDMLCGPLNGMAYGPHLAKMYDQLDQHRRLGSLVCAIDPSRFFGGLTLPTQTSAAIREIKVQAPSIRYPGEPEYLSEKIRSDIGIPIETSLWTDLTVWSQRCGISLPIS